MKIIVLLLVCLMLLLPRLNAQISFDSTDYPETVLGTDSLKVTTAASAFPSLAPATNAVWDMTIISDSIPVLYAYRVPTTSPYQFADSNMYSFAGFNYQGNVLSSIRSGGIFEYGINVLGIRQNISSITGGGLDSFIIPIQIDSFSFSRTKISFPIEYGNSWSSQYQSDIHTELTFLLGGDTLAPGIIRRYAVEQDSVTGWGKMMVKDASGSASPLLNVLQVKTMITYTDSFFLKGIPFSTTMLTFFSLTQGQKDTLYEQNYYRPQEVTPLAQVEFRDAGYTQPYKATTHVQRLQDVGVKNIAGDAKVSVYPNPVSGHELCVALTTTDTKWSYELTDISGRKVMNGTISKTTTLSIPAGVKPGIYYLKLANETGQISVTPVEIGE